MFQNKNGLKLRTRKVSMFKKFFFKTMSTHFCRIFENQPDNYALLTRRFDAVVYAYTGDEDVFLFNEPKAKAKKIQSYKALAQKISLMDRTQVLLYIAKILGLDNDKKYLAKFVKANAKFCRDSLIANLLFNIMLEVVLKKNPTIFTVNNKQVPKNNNDKSSKDEEKSK